MAELLKQCEYKNRGTEAAEGEGSGVKRGYPSSQWECGLVTGAVPSSQKINSV